MTDTREDEVTLNRAKYGGRTAQRQAPASPRTPRITRLMALAIKFQDMVDRGEVRDYAELARLGFVTRARLTQIMNLLLLAPDIQHVLLGPDLGGVACPERQLRGISSLVPWSAQRRAWTRASRAAKESRASRHDSERRRRDSKVLSQHEI